MSECIKEKSDVNNIEIAFCDFNIRKIDHFRIMRKCYALRFHETIKYFRINSALAMIDKLARIVLYLH